MKKTKLLTPLLGVAAVAAVVAPIATLSSCGNKDEAKSLTGDVSFLTDNLEDVTVTSWKQQTNGIPGYQQSTETIKRPKQTNRVKPFDYSEYELNDSQVMLFYLSEVANKPELLAQDIVDALYSSLCTWCCASTNGESTIDSLFKKFTVNVKPFDLSVSIAQNCLLLKSAEIVIEYQLKAENSTLCQDTIKLKDVPISLSVRTMDKQLYGSNSTVSRSTVVFSLGQPLVSYDDFNKKIRAAQSTNSAQAEACVAAAESLSLISGWSMSMSHKEESAQAQTVTYDYSTVAKDIFACNSAANPMLVGSARQLYLFCCGAQCECSYFAQQHLEANYVQQSTDKVSLVDNGISASTEGSTKINLKFIGFEYLTQTYAAQIEEISIVSSYDASGQQRKFEVISTSTSNEARWKWVAIGKPEGQTYYQAELPFKVAYSSTNESIAAGSSVMLHIRYNAGKTPTENGDPTTYVTRDLTDYVSIFFC